MAEIEEEPEPPDPLQEVLDRLEELALQDNVSSSITADLSDTDESVEIESLAEVLDWLEAQLAPSPAEETADAPPLEETTDFPESAEEAAVEEFAFDSDEMSDDDVMAFMNAILEDDASFIPEKDVSFIPDDPDAAPSFARFTPAVEEAPLLEAESDDFVDVIADLSLAESEEDVLAGMIDDVSSDISDDIEAFMNAILDDENSFIPEKDVSFNPDDPNALPSFALAQMVEDEPEEADLGELPDDPDMAIAWLQDLADAQDEAEDAEDLDSILPEMDEDFAVGLFADVAEVEETADTQESIEFDETLADSLPDWLEFDGEERLSGHTDWLRSLPEPDVAGWLEAEEEVMASNIFDEIPVPAESERLSSATSGYEFVPTLEPEEEMSEAESEADEQRVVPTFSLNTGVLNTARQALTRGQYDQALNQYRSLVEEGQGLSVLIADLETATEEHQQPLLRRLLGDAYMRNGQLQRALETYRTALDEL
jgi:tetratricopeptide (TPR) repeat protein